MFRTHSRLLFTVALVALALHPRAVQAQYKLEELRTDLAGAAFNGSNPDEFVEFNGYVYFSARFADGPGGAGLFRTDGTAAIPHWSCSSTPSPRWPW